AGPRRAAPGALHHGRRLDLDDGAVVHERGDLQERHGRVVPTHVPPPRPAQLLEAGQVRGAVGDEDGHAADVLGPAARGADDLEDVQERALELGDEVAGNDAPPGVARGLPGDEEDAPAGRREEAVVPPLGRAQGFGVDDLERHGLVYASNAPPSTTIVCPLMARAASSQSERTAWATSSGWIRRFCPVVARTARSASSPWSPVRAPTASIVRS